MQSLESIPTWFADFYDISLEAAQVILSIMVILAVLLPAMYLSRGTRGAITIQLILGLLVEALLVGIGWLPFWLLIATVAILALAIAALGTQIVTGG